MATTKAKRIYNKTIPEISSIKVAYEIQLLNTNLSSANVKKLFGNISDATIQRLKAIARAKMIELDYPVMNARLVNTNIAYQAWGLDIAELEKKYNKLVKLGFITVGESEAS